MTYVSIYPPSTSTTDPPRVPGILTASITSGGSIAPLSVPQTTPQLNLRDEIWKDHISKHRDLSDPSQKRSSSVQRCRNAAQETVHERGTRRDFHRDDLTAARYSPNSDDSDDFPDIDALLSGIKQKDISAAADPSHDEDNDGFLNIDELLAGLQQESSSASAKPGAGGTAGKVDDGNRGDSPVDSSRSTVGNTLDPIILSDDESVGSGPDSDFSSLDIDLTAKRDSYPLHVADNDLVDGDGSGCGTTVVSDPLIDDHQTAYSMAPSLCSLLGIQGQPPLAMGGANHVDVDVTKKIGDKDANVYAKGDIYIKKDIDNAPSTRRTRSPTASCNNPASNSNLFVPELLAGERDSAQSPQLGPAAASLQRSSLTSNPPPSHLCGRGAAQNASCKVPRTIARIGLASAARTVSATFESTDLEDEERECHDIDQEMVDDNEIGDSSAKDYANQSDTAGFKIRGRPNPRKRAKRKKDTDDQAAAATSPSGMHESEEIPIYGYLTLKTIESKVVYCLTLSQERRDQGRRREITPNLEEPQPDAQVADPNHQWGIRKISGQKVVGGERYYQVKWEDTWMHESELAGAEELVDAYVNGGSGTGGKKRPATGPPNAQSEKEPKKRRGRPRKQK